MRTLVMSLVGAVAAVALAGCIGTGVPKAVRAWVEHTYTPAVSAIHGPELAPWRRNRIPRPTAAELRRDCAEALRRHDTWDRALLGVSDQSLRRLVEDYVDGERAQLVECARTGEFDGVDHVRVVVQRLRVLGIAPEEVCTQPRQLSPGELDNTILK